MTKEEQTLRDELLKFWHNDLGQHETGGKNRSPMIDAVNKRLRVSLGSPYCIGALLVRGVEPLCTKYGLVNPVVMTAGTQNFYDRAPSKYKKPKGTNANKSDIVILQSRSDSSSGHAYALTEDQSGSRQKTIEYNTNKGLSRDGDGVYENTRSSNGSLTKLYRGAVDVIRWILDANPGFTLTKPTTPVVVEIPPPVVVPPVSSRMALSWENTNAPHPERKPWSDFVVLHFTQYLGTYSQAKDVTLFNSNFHKLTDSQKIKVLSELVVAVVYYESGYNPESSMVETTMGIDPVTKKQVVSAGLMQLSYQDVNNYKGKIEVSRIDYKLKNITDPIINLETGLGILKYQVKTKGAFVLSTGVYWSVLRKNGKRINQIIERVKKNTKF